MKEVTIKYETEIGNENSLIQNPIDVFKCESFNILNESMVGFSFVNGDDTSVIIPFRRIKEIRIREIK